MISARGSVEPSGAPTEATRSILICCVPRTGSWLLAEALEETGHCGHPREYFRSDYERIYAREWGLPPGYDYGAFVQGVRRAGTTPNGVFSAKLHWAQYAYALPRLRSLSGSGPSDLDVVREHFAAPTFVRLRREDTAAQAVSWYRAIKRDVWWRLDRTPTPDPPGPPTGPDFDEISRLERTIIDHEHRWTSVFRAAGLEPVAITYEQLVNEYAATVGRVLAAAGVTGVEPPLRPVRLRKQADELSHEWTDRYRQRREYEQCEPVC